MDESWKEQARREREEASQKEEGRPARRGPASRPDILFLINSLAMQALLYMGELAIAEKERPEPDLEQAKYAIDLLAVVEEKTKGNLTAEEEKVLKSVLYDLRTRYVAVAGVRNPMG